MSEEVKAAQARQPAASQGWSDDVDISWQILRIAVAMAVDILLRRIILKTS